jgi:hypothetical protein
MQGILGIYKKGGGEMESSGHNCPFCGDFNPDNISKFM